jgi:hypothetical protein
MSASSNQRVQGRKQKSKKGNPDLSRSDELLLARKSEALEDGKKRNGKVEEVKWCRGIYISRAKSCHI